MIFNLIYDDDGGVALELNKEGAEYLTEGLLDLRYGDIACMSTPSFWEESPPWWRFWNRKKTMVLGEFRLRLVEDESAG